MAKRYRKTFDFFNTEQEAAAFCSSCNKNAYLRKNHPAHYTPWQSMDGKKHLFVAWYYTK